MAVQSATASQLRNFLRFTIHWHAEYSGTVLGLVRARIFPCPCVAAQARAGYIVQSNVSGAINHQEPPHGQFELASKVLLVAHFPEKVRDSWKTNSHEIALNSINSAGLRCLVETRTTSPWFWHLSLQRKLRQCRSPQELARLR